MTADGRSAIGLARSTGDEASQPVPSRYLSSPWRNVRCTHTSSHITLAPSAYSRSVASSQREETETTSFTCSSKSATTHRAPRSADAPYRAKPASRSPAQSHGVALKLLAQRAATTCRPSIRPIVDATQLGYAAQER